MFDVISFEKEIPSGGSQAGNISQSCSLKDADFPDELINLNRCSAASSVVV